MEIVLGQFVKAIAGRDAGYVYIVIGHDKSCLLLADGRDKTVSKPKLKNPRHVTVCKAYAHSILAKIKDGMKVTNEDLRQEILSWRKSGKLSESDEEG